MIWYFIVSQRSFNGALATEANVKLSQVKQHELNRFVLFLEGKCTSPDCSH